MQKFTPNYRFIDDLKLLQTKVLYTLLSDH